MILIALKAIFAALLSSLAIQTAPAGVTNHHLAALDQKQYYCMVEAVYFEAGNQTLEGKIAVANVIKNRASAEGFPNDLCSVVHQHGQFTYKIKQIPADKPSILQVQESMIASELVMRQAVADNTKGALYYLNPKIAKDHSWTKTFHRTVKIGDHSFYKTT